MRSALALAIALVIAMLLPPQHSLANPVGAPGAPPLPIHTVPRSAMPAHFASDAMSRVDEIFGRQRYGVSVGDPIDVRSGAYYFTTTDLSVHARGLSFAFTRSYNSADDWFEPDGSSFLGAGWRHSYWWEITDVLAGASGCGGMLMRGDGTRERIVTDGTNADYSACSFDGVLTTVTLRDQTRYVFGNRFDYIIDCVSCVPGRSLYQLLRIELPTGDRMLLSYAGSPLGAGHIPVVATVTDTVGRSYQFSYDVQAHLTQLTDPAARTVRFAYDALGRLVSATDDYFRGAKLATRDENIKAQLEVLWQKVQDGVQIIDLGPVNNRSLYYAAESALLEATNYSNVTVILEP